MHRSSTDYKWKQFKTILNWYAGDILMCEQNRGWTSSPEETLLLWTRFGQKQCFKVKTQTCSFLLKKTWIDGLESCGLLVDCCDVFISCLYSHSDSTHSLQIYWWASDVMLHFFKFVQHTNSSTSWIYKTVYKTSTQAIYFALSFNAKVVLTNKYSDYISQPSKWWIKQFAIVAQNYKKNAGSKPVIDSY